VTEERERTHAIGRPDVIDVDGISPHDAEGLERLLDRIHRSRGFDFTGYARTTLARRTQRRMRALSITSYAEYLGYLEVRPDELPQLFNAILVNVSAFYRDAPAWAALKALLVRRLAEREPGTPIRVWSAGCASGEEPYTLATILADILGRDQYADRVKIYATDVDEASLAAARLATYSHDSVASVPGEVLEKYFTFNGAAYLFDKDLRRAVIFGRHDLMQDAPISRIDILACRNTLVYFNAETQTRILSRLHFALNDDGALLLGQAETLVTHASLFTPLDLKLRLFARERGRVRQRASFDGRASTVDDEPTRLVRAAFDRGPCAQIVLDPRGCVRHFNSRAVHLFALTQRDVSRPFHDLEVSHQPTDLRSCFDRVRKDRRPMHLRTVERPRGSGEPAYFDIDIVPLLAETGTVLGTQISFAEISEPQRLQSELRKANLGLESARGVLHAASAELETTNEELQANLEELQTTNEELQTTSEELQTTNEELRTMNQELQSNVAELRALNDELRQRGDDLVALSMFFASVLGSLRAGVAVLDRDLLVRTWNPKMEELWGLRAEAVEGKAFVTLAIGLPIDPLTAKLRACLATGEESVNELECTSGDGRPVRCRVALTALQGASPTGVTLVIDELTSSQ
jgi:two-component system, chemotaxis family, CheB/CheR fusion protein